MREQVGGEALDLKNVRGGLGRRSMAVLHSLGNFNSFDSVPTARTTSSDEPEAGEFDDFNDVMADLLSDGEEVDWGVSGAGKESRDGSSSSSSSGSDSSGSSDSSGAQEIQVCMQIAWSIGSRRRVQDASLLRPDYKPE